LPADCRPDRTGQPGARAGRRRLGYVADARGDNRQSLVRLAALLVRDQAAAERVVRDVLESSPLEGRDAAADRQAVVIRCRGILRERRRPDG